jgi:hypothetical protein
MDEGMERNVQRISSSNEYPTGACQRPAACRSGTARPCGLFKQSDTRANPFTNVCEPVSDRLAHRIAEPHRLTNELTVADGFTNGIAEPDRFTDQLTVPD